MSNTKATMNNPAWHVLGSVAFADIKVGDYVRSFDFPWILDLTGDRANYVEGVVQEIGVFDFEGFSDRCYKIGVVEEVRSGKRKSFAHLPSSKRRTVYPPLNGPHCFFTGEAASAVVRITGAARRWLAFLWSRVGVEFVDSRGRPSNERSTR